MSLDQIHNVYATVSTSEMIGEAEDREKQKQTASPKKAQNKKDAGKKANAEKARKAAEAKPKNMEEAVKKVRLRKFKTKWFQNRPFFFP